MFGRDKSDSEEPEITNVPVQTPDDSFVPAPTDDGTMTPVADPSVTDASAAEEVSEPVADEASAEPTPELPVEVPASEAQTEQTPEPETLPTADTEVVDVSSDPIPENPLDEDEPADTVAMPMPPASNDLAALKMEALHELSPLIGQLEQSPEEKYETAKMVYEETNDQSMLAAVFEAAKSLLDDHAKANAIYDVIKKINAL